MSRRGRSRSKSYYSEAGGEYVDTKSKQLLFHEAQVCTLGRTRLGTDEPFRESVAKELLAEHYRKRKSHGFVLCLVDRMRFQKHKNTASKSYRKDLTYRDIKHFYMFKEMPQVFVLCVEEENTGKRTYESFKCKKDEDVLIIQNLTAEAFRDPQFLLRHGAALRQISMSPSLSNDSRLHNGQINSNTISVVSANPNRNSTIYYSTYDQQQQQPQQQQLVQVQRRSPTFMKAYPRHTSPPSRHSPDDLYRYRSRPVSIERQIDRKERSLTVGSAPTHNGLHWSEEITYLITDAEHGPQLTDYGPIYMYVSRSQHTEANHSNIDNSPLLRSNRLSYR